MGPLEIEMKKIAAPCGFGSPAEVYRVIELVTWATTQKVFVKLYQSNNRDSSLVWYIILYNIHSFKSFKLVQQTLPPTPLLGLRKFQQKVGILVYPYQKIDNVYSSDLGWILTKMG